MKPRSQRRRANRRRWRRAPPFGRAERLHLQGRGHPPSRRRKGLSRSCLEPPMPVSWEESNPLTKLGRRVASGYGAVPRRPAPRRGGPLRQEKEEKTMGEGGAPRRGGPWSTGSMTPRGIRWTGLPVRVLWPARPFVVTHPCRRYLPSARAWTQDQLSVRTIDDFEVAIDGPGPCGGRYLDHPPAGAVDAGTHEQCRHAANYCTSARWARAVREAHSHMRVQHSQTGRHIRGGP